MVLLCWWNFYVAYYLTLEGLAWIVGWNIAALRLGCDVLSYVILCISFITLMKISFHKHCGCE